MRSSSRSPEPLSLDPDSGGGLASLGGPFLAPVFASLIVITGFLWLGCMDVIAWRRHGVVRETVIRTVKRHNPPKGQRGIQVTYRVPLEGRDAMDGWTIVPFSAEGRYQPGQRIEILLIDGPYPTTTIRRPLPVGLIELLFYLSLPALIASGGLVMMREFAREARRQRIREQRRTERS